MNVSTFLTVAFTGCLPSPLYVMSHVVSPAFAGVAAMARGSALMPSILNLAMSYNSSVPSMRETSALCPLWSVTVALAAPMKGSKELMAVPLLSVNTQLLSANTLPSALYVVSFNTDLWAFFMSAVCAMHCMQPIMIVAMSTLMCFIFLYLYFRFYALR